jgi:hypothetical protein
MQDREKASSKWKGLFVVGGIAPLVTIVFYFVEFSLVFVGEYPTTVEGWLALFGRGKVLGLLYLNALDILSISLLGVMFLAIYILLRERDESLAAIAAFGAGLGVAVFVATRSILTAGTLALSDQYSTAATDAQRTQVIQSAQAIHTLGQATLQTPGFFFLAVAVLLFSTIMLRCGMKRITAWAGISVAVFTLLDDWSVILLPSVATPLMVVGGIFWLAWWVLVGIWLLRLSRTASG